MSKKFRQAMKNTFCLIPSLTNYLEVTRHSIISHTAFGERHEFTINRSTRGSTNGWGYANIDTNFDHEQGEFCEINYPRVMDIQGFLAAVYDAKQGHT